jgi:type II secretory ATPase GspE/PulE/Tfp pilus assembly ATPase PilB-like protein
MERVTLMAGGADQGTGPAWRCPGRDVWVGESGGSSARVGINKAMVVGDPLLRLMSRDTDEAIMKYVLENAEFEGLVQKAIINAENASRSAKYWNTKKWK